MAARPVATKQQAFTATLRVTVLVDVAVEATAIDEALESAKAVKVKELLANDVALVDNDPIAVASIAANGVWQ